MFFLKSFWLYYYKFHQEENKKILNKREKKNFYIRTQKTKKHTLFAKKKKISHSKKDAFFRGNWHHTMIWMTYSNLKPQKVEKLKYEWWKTFKNKTFWKRKPCYFGTNKIHFTCYYYYYIYLSFYLKRTTKFKPQTENPTLSSPVSSLYPTCTTISIKRNKKYDNYHPLLTSKITKKKLSR